MLTLNYKYLRLSLVGLGLLHDKLASAVSTYQYIWCQSYLVSLTNRQPHLVRSIKLKTTNMSSFKISTLCVGCFLSFLQTNLSFFVLKACELLLSFVFKKKGRTSLALQFIRWVQ